MPLRTVWDPHTGAFVTTGDYATGGGGGGTVELGATSLAALEHISVDAIAGTVGLDSATLAALETINANILDGTDAAQGAIADAAATAGGTGTISAKLRVLTGSIGAIADAAWASGSGSVIALLKAIAGRSYSATPTLTNVNDQATNITLMSANAARKAGSIYNDSTSILYLKYGATATSTSFTIKLFSQDYHEIFGGYTGQIDGIWDVDGSGAARMTELT